jgi:prolyl-tRNA editing enzyme YbaK/EbsC (Cys-tRNA(Pro) deacylase)
MHPNAARVAEAAAAGGVAIDVVEHPAGTRTADDAAAAVGAPVAAIVKSLVFLVDERPVMALVGGDRRLDEDRLREATAGAVVARADADLVREATGFPIGGVPPFGHRTPMPIFVDGGLLEQPAVWAAAGTPRHVFRISPEDLVRLSGATVAAVAT